MSTDGNLPVIKEEDIVDGKWVCPVCLEKNLARELCVCVHCDSSIIFK
jgi:hypothetical protein